MASSLSVKPLDWVRGAKEIRLGMSGPDLSDGTRACEGCGKIVRKGGTITKEHVDIVTSTGAQEWRELTLCSECYYQICEMVKGLRSRGKRKPEWMSAPPEGILNLDAADLDGDWRAVIWGLHKAEDVVTGESELEDPLFASEEYPRLIAKSIDRIKDALAELQMFLLWRATEVAIESKKEEPKP
jgi:hypothetical protein